LGAAASLRPRAGDQNCDRRGCCAGAQAVGAAGENDRHPGAKHDAGGIGATGRRQLLGQHVARLQVGHDQDVGLSGDR
jgi:hypothetical protein